jgi:hypothetical protein
LFCWFSFSFAAITLSSSPKYQKCPHPQKKASRSDSFKIIPLPKNGSTMGFVGTILASHCAPHCPSAPAFIDPESRPENELFQSGLGMCCRPTAYDDVLVERSVLWYLLMDGRLIDTAHIYLNH